MPNFQQSINNMLGSVGRLAALRNLGTALQETTQSVREIGITQREIAEAQARSSAAEREQEQAQTLRTAADRYISMGLPQAEPSAFGEDRAYNEYDPEYQFLRVAEYARQNLSGEQLRAGFQNLNLQERAEFLKNAQNYQAKAKRGK